MWAEFAMRKSIEEFVRICSETFSIPGPIYEFGSLQIPGPENCQDLRLFFSDKKYVGADMRPGQGVDVILNLHNIDLPTKSVGTVLILDTLEHVEFARKAMEEVYRILEPNGIVIVSSVMNFAIHSHPYDYWRFTPEAFRSLLKAFNSCFVGFAGDTNFPHTVVGIGFKGNISEDNMDEFRQEFKSWKADWDFPPKETWRKLLKLLMPPILVSLCRKIGRICR